MESARAGGSLDRGSPLPLWAQLYDDLRRRLEAGEFARSFPAELDLARDYHVSRNTVREAMRRLRADGAVVAGRGRRPRVAEGTEIEQPLGALYSLFASVEASGLDQHSEVRALCLSTDPDAARQLECGPSTPLVFLERLRFAGGEPLALDRIWIREELGSALLDADFTHTGFYDELLRRAGVVVSGGREHIRAVLAGDSERDALRLPVGAAALAINRLGCSKGQPVEWRRTLLRGDRFSVVADFSPREGYQLGAALSQGTEDASAAPRTT